MRCLGWAALAALALVVACSDASTTPSHVVVVHGTAATGAHTRTPLARGYVGVLGPQGPNAGHWIRYVSPSASGLASEATTGADGTYRYTVETSVLTGGTNGQPFFIAVSDDAQTLTMLAEIPQDLVKDGADLAIDINPSTTVASELICPGGVLPPPANSWCYSAPATASTDNAALIAIVDRALSSDLASADPGTPPGWSTFVGAFVNDAPTYSAIASNLSARGITPTTPITIAPLPLVHPSAAAPSTVPSGCNLVWDCGASTQCAGAYGAAKGSRAEPDAKTCASVCASAGACSCQGC